MATIAELILEQGRQQAEARRRQGEITGQTWQNLANLISRTGQQIEQERVEAPIRKQQAELRTKQLATADADLALKNRTLDQDKNLSALLATGTPPTLTQLVSAGGVERGLAIAQGMRALQTASDTDVRDLVRGLGALPEAERATYYPTARQALITRGRIRAEDAPEAYDPQWWSQKMGEQGRAEPKTREVKVRNADGTETIKIVEDKPGFEATSVAETKKYPVTVAGLGGNPIQKLVTEEELAKGVPAYRAAKEEEHFWVFRDGKPVRITESQYRRGDLPANTREQGRPVIAGDAEDLANFDVSRDELDTLKSVIAPIDPRTGKVAAGATGVGAQIGAAIPAWATDLTGWGIDAKKKQAVIDRVKQIIGKSLEGGVLRKEDEAKYEKILPTVKDTTDVVVAKLSGLAETLDKRKVRRLDALEDAGFNVEKFRARAAAGAAASTVRMRAPNGQEQDVPASQVEHYKSLGATVIK